MFNQNICAEIQKVSDIQQLQLIECIHVLLRMNS